MSDLVEDYVFSQRELDLMSRLPEDVLAFASKYPMDVANAAEYWDSPPYPSGYVPTSVEIYYTENGDNCGSSISIYEGQVTGLDLSAKDVKLIAVCIDADWAYIEIEGKIILNRLGGVILPEINISPEQLMQLALKG